MRRLLRTIIVSTAAIANAYVPSHMELPETWRDVSAAAVRVALRYLLLVVDVSTQFSSFVVVFTA